MSGVIWQRHSLTQKSVRANWNKENWLWFQLPLLTRVSNSRLLFHLNMETNREKHVSPGLFLSQREPRMSSHSHCYSSRNRPAADLIWTERHCCCCCCCRGHFPLRVCCGTGTLNKIVGPCRAEPSRAWWPWRTTSWQQISSCIDFYFRGWVIWVAALQPQLGWPPRSAREHLGICYCLYRFVFAARVYIDALSGSPSAATFISCSFQNKMKHTIILLSH